MNSKDDLIKGLQLTINEITKWVNENCHDAMTQYSKYPERNKEEARLYGRMCAYFEITKNLRTIIEEFNEKFGDEDE